MGFWQAFTREARSIFMLDSPASATFSEEYPRPIDQLLYHAATKGGSLPKVSRAEALSVPAVLRGRNQICNVSTLPLGVVNENRKPVPSAFLKQIDPDVPNVVTLAQTLEDLFFEGTSFWLKTAWDLNGDVLHARHLAWESVTLQPPATTRTPAPLPSGIDPRGAIVYVDGKRVDWDDVIMYHSPSPGILQAAARPILRAIKLDNSANMYADNPMPLNYFAPVEGADPASPAVVQDILDNWAVARQAGSTAYVPASLKYNIVDVPTPASLQLVEQQREVDRQLSNSMGIDAVDVGVSVTSDTYQNAVDRRQDKVNTVLAGYMLTITQRLSMDDVTRPGEKVVFDLDDYLRADPKTRAEVDAIRIQNGTKTAEEARKDENMPDLPAGQRPAAPAPEAPAVPQTVGASRWVSVQLDSDEPLTFADVPLSTFAVNAEARTITGLAVPFNKIALNQGRRWRFAEGSLEFAELGRVKLLRDHDRAQAVGRAVELTQTADGYVVKFSIARGPDGDRVLALAEDGVLDGLSIGVDIADAIPDPNNRGALLVRKALLREVSLTAMPAFDDSRLTSVQATRDEGNTMSDDATPEPQAPAAPASVPDLTFNMDELVDKLAAKMTKPADERPVVNPTRSIATFVNEPIPYRFTYEGGRHVFRTDAEYDFSTDLFAVINGRTTGRDVAAPMARVDTMIQAAFADVESADVTALNPNRHRPDMWQPQMDYATPLWDMVNSGSTDGTKFDVPKYDSSSGLVGPATEKVEPASGTMAATLQTVTPTQVWGKVEITRQAWRAGGNPQLSGILWDQMLREYFEDREAAVATFLNTLTAAADIALTGRPATTPDNDDDRVTANDLEAAIADLQFVRGGNRFRAFAVHQDLYRLLARVKDADGRPLYPQINPMNANGTAANLFSTLNVAGTVAVPSWALGAGGQTTATNSWLFDPAKVRGWASAPERLFWDFGATVQTANIPQLSYVTLGIYGDVAMANLDINGVRQVTFDPSV